MKKKASAKPKATAAPKVEEAPLPSWATQPDRRERMRRQYEEVKEQRLKLQSMHSGPRFLEVIEQSEHDGSRTYVSASATGDTVAIVGEKAVMVISPYSGEAIVCDADIRLALPIARRLLSALAKAIEVADRSLEYDE